MKSELGNDELDILTEKAQSDGGGAFMWTEAASGEDFAAANKAAAKSRERFRESAQKRYEHRKP